jgi:5-methylthioribose kinase
MQKQRVTSFAADIGEYMAKTLFGSSGLALDGGTLRAKIAHWSQNSALCALTEKVVFTDPYAVVDHNRWTVPQLDNYGHGIKKDSELKLAAAYHKSLFLTSAETLLHGDLHTGSWMVKQDSTFMIDPEFAFYGPMGFDVGAILSNLFLSYFSFVGRDADYAEWILQQVVIVVDTFTTLFLQLWTEHNHSETSIATGEIYRSSIFTDELLNHAQNGYMAHIWRDSLGFAGMKMLRRVVGISHVADLESIENPDVRAGAEKRALLFARKLIVTSYANRVAQEGLSSVQDLINAARVVFVTDPAEEWPGSTTTTIV